MINILANGAKSRYLQTDMNDIHIAFHYYANITFVSILFHQIGAISATNILHLNFQGISIKIHTQYPLGLADITVQFILKIEVSGSYMRVCLY